MSDKIHIRDINGLCLIGTNPEERQRPQEIVVNIALECDLGPACKSDRLEDSVDYAALKDKIVAVMERGKFSLLEKLAEEISEICLADHRVSTATVIVDKPLRLTGCQSAAVEIRRSRRS